MPDHSHKLPRIVQLDQSDTEVYECTAKPGEWAVPGGFEFLNDSHDTLKGKRLQAFRSGFLGVGSFGRATLVTIGHASESDYQGVIEELSEYLLERYDAPDRAAAAAAAQEEVRYTESLCEYDEGVLLALERELTEDGVAESFKKFIPSTTVDWEQAKPLVYQKVVTQEE